MSSMKFTRCSLHARSSLTALIVLSPVPPSFSSKSYTQRNLFNAFASLAAPITSLWLFFFMSDQSKSRTAKQREELEKVAAGVGGEGGSEKGDKTNRRDETEEGGNDA